MQKLLYTRFYKYSRRIYKKLAYYAIKMYNYAINSQTKWKYAVSEKMDVRNWTFERFWYNIEKHSVTWEEGYI